MINYILKLHNVGTGNSAMTVDIKYYSVNQ